MKYIYLSILFSIFLQVSSVMAQSSSGAIQHIGFDFLEQNTPVEISYCITVRDGKINYEPKNVQCEGCMVEDQAENLFLISSALWKCEGYFNHGKAFRSQCLDRAERDLSEEELQSCKELSSRS